MSAVSALLFSAGVASWVFGVAFVKKARRIYCGQHRPGLEMEQWPAPSWQRRLFGKKVELLPPEVRRLIVPSWVLITAGALCIGIAIVLLR